MSSSYGKSNNKTSSTDVFNFDLGLGSGRSRPLNGQKGQISSYTQPKSNTTSSWTHQPEAPVQSSGPGSLSGPTSLVGDIFGKSWSSSGSSSSSVTDEVLEKLHYLVKVLEQDGKNVNMLVQRSLLYESLEKCKLLAEDLRTVMNIDPGNRVARSAVHRLTKMASG